MLRRTPLKARTKLRRKSRLRPKNEKRSREVWRLVYHSKAFVEFVRGLPCVVCGNRPSVAHHDPTRKSGGTWMDVSSLCASCHDLRHRIGVKSFWKAAGMTFAEAAKLTHMRWLAREA